MDDPATLWRSARMVDYRDILAANLRAARKARALSQESLALEAGIDRTYISGIERGKRNPSLGLIVQLAQCLQSTPAALLTAPLLTAPDKS